MTSRVIEACSFAAAFLGLAALANCNPGETPPPASADAFHLGGPIVFQRSGGVAGFDDRIEIQPDGVVRSGSDVHRRTLTPEELEQLAKAVEGASDGPPSPGADQIRYAITYRDKTVRWTGAATPGELAPVISLLLDLTQP